MAKCFYCGAEVNIGEPCAFCGSRAEPYLYPDVGAGWQTEQQHEDTPKLVPQWFAEKVYRILAKELNVRYKPTTTSEVVSHVHRGENHTVVQVVEGGNMRWGKLKSGVGWISLKYAVPISELNKPDSEYKVVSGDCLNGICKKFYGCSDIDIVHNLAKYNHIKKPDLIYPNQIIKIPHIGKLVK